MTATMEPIKSAAAGGASQDASKTVFITGASGFVGHYVVAAVLRAGHSVMANVRATGISRRRSKKLASDVYQ